MPRSMNVTRTVELVNMTVKEVDLATEEVVVENRERVVRTWRDRADLRRKINKEAKRRGRVLLSADVTKSWFERYELPVELFVKYGKKAG